MSNGMIYTFGKQSQAAADTGATEQQPAAAAEDVKDQTDVEDVDTNEPEESGTDTGEDIEDKAGENGGESAEDGKGEKMSREERAANAKRRREQERQALEQSIRDEESRRARSDIDAKIAGMRLRDAEGNLITTLDQLDASNAARREEMLNEGLERLGIDRELLETIVDNHPAIRQAQSVISQAKAAESAALDKTAQMKLDTELAEIGKLDPTIKSFEDLKASPKYAEVRKRVTENRVSISEAFYLANREEIAARQAQAVAQSTANSIRGKDHLRHDASHGAGEIEIPAAVMKSYRNAYPNLSDEQIRLKYKDLMKSQKKG